MIELLQAVGAVVLAGIVQGVVTWAAMRVEVRYLRRDVDRALWRLDNLPCGGLNRRSTDCQGNAP